MNTEEALRRLGEWRRKIGERALRQAAAEDVARTIEAEAERTGRSGYVFTPMEGSAPDQLLCVSPKSIFWDQADGAYYQWFFAPYGKDGDHVPRKTALKMLELHR